MSFELTLTLIWTALSFAAVSLAYYGMQIAAREEDDTKRELIAQRERAIPNGVLILGLQQASQATLLRWMHRGAFTHQLLFFLIGLMSLYFILSGIADVDAPTTHLDPLVEMFVPLCLLAAQFVIVGMQVCLIMATRGQRTARYRLLAVEKNDADVTAEVVKEMASRLKEMEDAAFEDHEGGRIHRKKDIEEWARQARERGEDQSVAAEDRDNQNEDLDISRRLEKRSDENHRDDE